MKAILSILIVASFSIAYAKKDNKDNAIALINSGYNLATDGKKNDPNGSLLACEQKVDQGSGLGYSAASAGGSSGRGQTK